MYMGGSGRESWDTVFAVEVMDVVCFVALEPMVRENDRRPLRIPRTWDFRDRVPQRCEDVLVKTRLVGLLFAEMWSGWMGAGLTNAMAQKWITTTMVSVLLTRRVSAVEVMNSIACNVVVGWTIVWKNVSAALRYM
jgi:hypothetical protein